MLPAVREIADRKISIDLKKILVSQRGPLGFYWPFRGEFDPRPVVKDWLSFDTTNVACLPVIIERNKPMIFREWFPGTPMTKGTFNICVPDTKNRVLIPNTLLVPTLGFNQRNFRLGYGGGYYDRTLAQLNAFTIGLCFEHGRSSKIVEERHDIPLDLIIVG
jgi:5-formyltetrahydrofolate cyclo-ligase